MVFLLLLLFLKPAERANHSGVPTHRTLQWQPRMNRPLVVAKQYVHDFDLVLSQILIAEAPTNRC